MTGSEKEVVLESMAVDPFNDWDDWHDQNSKAVVTFETMKHNLWNSWKTQCIENNEYNDSEEEIRPEKFNAEKVRKPGVYRDAVNEEDKIDELYTVIVPRSFLTPELCERYLEKLNEKFDRNFKLKIKPEQMPPTSELKRIKPMIERENEEVAEKLEGLIEELKK